MLTVNFVHFPQKFKKYTKNATQSKQNKFKKWKKFENWDEKCPVYKNGTQQPPKFIFNTTFSLSKLNHTPKNKIPPTVQRWSRPTVLKSIEM